MERRQGVRVTRSVSIEEASPGSFLFHQKKGETPRSATIAVPQPFTGTAEYLKEPGRPASWVGPLAAHLPGAGLVALPGPGFPAARPILADPRHIKLYARDGVPPEQRRGMAESA